MNLYVFISKFRWPMFIVGILLMSITAQGILVYVATRSNAPLPIDDYYERSLRWDIDTAALAQSKALGWTVKFVIPEGQQYAVAARRPVDIQVHDRSGEPISGLVGNLQSINPAQSRWNDSSEFVELPYSPGQYRTLARLSTAGLWELRLDAHLDTTRFVHAQRVILKDEEHAP